jgi:hypothetical protein
MFQGSLYRNQPSREESKQATLHKLNKLSENWGYRAGKTQEHLHFEKALEEDVDLYYAITPFTDPLMRTLQQDNTAFESDLKHTFQEVQDIKDTLRAQQIAEFLHPFVQNQENHQKLSWLSRQELHETRHSWIFAAWVLSARALLLLSPNKRKKEKKHVEKEVYRIFRYPNIFSVKCTLKCPSGAETTNLDVEHTKRHSKLWISLQGEPRLGQKPTGTSSKSLPQRD